MIFAAHALKIAVGGVLFLLALGCVIAVAALISRYRHSVRP